MSLSRVESVAGAVKGGPDAKRSKGAEGTSIDPFRLGVDMNTYYEMIQGLNGERAGTEFSGNFKVCEDMRPLDSLCVEVRLKPEEELSGNFKESKTGTTYHQSLTLEKPYLKLVSAEGHVTYFTDIGLNLGRKNVSRVLSRAQNAVYAKLNNFAELYGPHLETSVHDLNILAKAEAAPAIKDL